MAFSNRRINITPAGTEVMQASLSVLAANEAELITVPQPVPATKTTDAAQAIFYGQDNWPQIQAIRRTRDFAVRETEMNRQILCKLGQLMPQGTPFGDDDYTGGVTAP